MKCPAYLPQSASGVVLMNSVARFAPVAGLDGGAVYAAYTTRTSSSQLPWRAEMNSSLPSITAVIIAAIAIVAVTTESAIRNLSVLLLRRRSVVTALCEHVGCKDGYYRVDDEKDARDKRRDGGIP